MSSANSHTNEVNERAIEPLLNQLKNGLAAEPIDIEKAQWSLENIRLILTNPDNIGQVIEAGFLPLLEKCFSEGHHTLRTTALLMLCDIARGDAEQTEYVISYLPQITQLLQAESTEPETRTRFICCLAKVAGHSVNHRNKLLECTPLSLLHSLQVRYSQPNLLESLARLTGSIVQHGPNASGAALRDDAVDILSGIVAHNDVCDCAVISAVCWASQRLLHSLAVEDALEALKRSDIIRRVVQHATHFPQDMECRRSCFTEMIKLIADLLSSDNTTCQAFIEQGALHVLSIVMEEERCELYHQACFAISNVFACGSRQIECAIECDLLTAAVHQLEHGDYRVQREAAIALSNFLQNARTLQVLEAFNRGLVPPFVQQLRSIDPLIIYDTLVSLMNLMKHAIDFRKRDECLQEMIDCGIEEHINVLEHVDHDRVAGLARHFRETFLRQLKDGSSPEGGQIEHHWSETARGSVSATEQ